LVTWF